MSNLNRSELRHTILGSPMARCTHPAEIEAQRVLQRIVLEVSVVMQAAWLSRDEVLSLEMAEALEDASNRLCDHAGDIQQEYQEAVVDGQPVPESGGPDEDRNLETFVGPFSHGLAGSPHDRLRGNALMKISGRMKRQYATVSRELLTLMHAAEALEAMARDLGANEGATP